MRNKSLRNVIVVGIAVFTAFRVIGRLISDVHWLSDIIGGALFSAGLDPLYFAATRDEFAIRNNEKEVLK